MKKIIAIDDDPVLLSFYEAVFSDDATGFPTVEEALDFLADTEACVVVLDFYIPNSKGTIDEHIKKLIEYAPVIVRSGVVDARVGESCINAGASHYFFKNGDHQKFIRTVLSYCKE